MSQRGPKYIACEECGATLAHVQPDGLVWWVNGWHRKNVPMEDPERNTLVFAKPRRKAPTGGQPVVMEFRRPVRQVCRQCGFLDTVD